MSRFLKRNDPPGHIVLLLFLSSSKFKAFDVGAVESLDRLQAVILALADS